MKELTIKDIAEMFPDETHHQKEWRVNPEVVKIAKEMGMTMSEFMNWLEAKEKQ